jgi:hypothetical protein
VPVFDCLGFDCPKPNPGWSLRTGVQPPGEILVAVECWEGMLGLERGARYKTGMKRDFRVTSSTNMQKVKVSI